MRRRARPTSPAAARRRAARPAAAGSRWCAGRCRRRSRADAATPGIFRYASLLPRRSGRRAHLAWPRAHTPLLDIPAAGAAAGVPRLLAKDESRNPTGTFKDRAMALAASASRGPRAPPGIVCASTGNAGASAAAYGARAGLPVVILVPVGTPPAKMAQAAVCGARVVAVRGTYSDAWAMAAAVSASLGWLNATTTFTCPYVVEGRAPWPTSSRSSSACPTGWRCRSAPARCWSGCTAASTTSGALGRIERASRGCSRCSRRAARRSSARSRSARRPVRGSRPETIASGLADPLAGYPKEGDVTVAAIVASGGAAVAVDDAATLDAISLLAGREGLFQEPASAIAIAGVAEARRRGLIGADDAVVACLTGTGLKDPHAAAGGAPQEFSVVTSLGDLERDLGRA